MDEMEKMANSLTVDGKSYKVVESMAYGYKVFKVKIDSYSISIEYAKDHDRSMTGYCIFIKEHSEWVASSLHNTSNRYNLVSEIESFISSKIK